MIEEITSFHSSYGVDRQPGAGAAADQRLHRRPLPGQRGDPFLQPDPGQVPEHPDGLFVGSFGHARGQNQANVIGALGDLQDKWIDHYLKGAGPARLEARSPPTPRPARTAPTAAAPLRPTTGRSIAPGEIV